MPARLEPADPRPVVRFTFNGRHLTGREGEPVAAALMASGIDILHRSLKFRNPRGVRCASGRCGQCMVEIDGRANVRSCSEPLREGMRVRTQRGWPSAGFDLGRPLGLVASYLPYGFQYRMFIRPGFMRPAYFKMMRRMSGYGRVDASITKPEPPPPPRSVQEVDVLVIGGGVSGMACALAAEDGGASVVLLDDQTELGGTARFDPAADPWELVAGCHSSPRIDVLLERQVVGYDDGVCSAQTPDGIEKYRPKVLVIASGGYDFIPPFDGNDFVRVYGRRAILRILRGWRVQPAATAAVVGPGAEELAAALTREGMYAQVEQAARRPGPDEAVVCAGSIPSYELPTALGLVTTVDEAGAIVAHVGEGGVTSRPDVFVTGEAAGNCGPAEAARRGAETGEAVARVMAGEHLPWSPISRARPVDPDGPVPGAMLCFCEDVTEEEFAEALLGDYPDIESAKRYTSMSMGVCQGKYCIHRARCITAYVRGTPLSETPITTTRPPFMPVALGKLAAQPEEATK
jgi:sarcosine oxidase subunit alpha